MKRYLNAICGMAVSAFTISTLTATLLPTEAMAKGANPNGKPFVEIAGAIVEVEGEVSSLQDQIDSLVGRVETIEDAQAAMQASIVDLQAENVGLQAQINANADDVNSLEGQISDLNSEVLILEAQIADLGDADGSLQAQIDAHDATITTLALSIDTLEGELQASIDNNNSLIAQMQQEITSIDESLALYQLLVSGSCPAGQSIRQIAADGSVVCEVDDVTGTSSVTEIRVFKFISTVAGYARGSATCPAGSTLTGGGFRGNFGTSDVFGGWPDISSQMRGEYNAEVRGAEYEGTLFVQAICIDFN